MKKSLISILTASLLSVLSFADDTGTVSQVTAKQGNLYKTTFTWTTGTNNNSVIAVSDSYIRGELLRVVFDPITSARPTHTYDIVLLDESGIDLLAGKGASLATGTVTTVRPGIISTVSPITNIAPFAVNDLVTVSVTNGGNSISGKLVIYTR